MYIKVAFSLDTDTFIHGLERLVARRGEPKEIWSDNGTNWCTSGIEERYPGMESRRDPCSYTEERNRLEVRSTRRITQGLSVETTNTNHSTNTQP